MGGNVSTRVVNIVKPTFGRSQPADMSGPVAQFVKDAILQDTIVIFSKSYCPYCTMAKEVFQKLQRKFTTIELDGRDDGDQIQSVLGEITGARTVPRVFIKGEFVGGGSDVKNLYENGKLEKMLQ
ncbi:glutaredoxin-C4-like isoform X2 [Cimex lectularius]|uniref:Glutaredoxin-2, mitochondrial n=1 Tax=Cimex lectularius TaxID=79782 RepID=A0A8I6TBR4_CIMLE|nr:glutaredoxin-C4-like isoform X2 [Cimex lectularius]